MCNMLISINPQHVENIFNGSKKYEYRKIRCKQDIDKIIISSTYPIMKVVGEAKVEKILEDSPDRIWEKTKKYSGIDLNFYQKYFKDTQEDFDEPIFYIAGSQTLPPPLPEEEETEYIKKLSNEDNLEARQVLIERNLILVVYIAKKFENTGINIEDLISIGTIGLAKSVNTFNADKNIKLATYASRCIENEILMHLRRTNKIKG